MHHNFDTVFVSVIISAGLVFSIAGHHSQAEASTHVTNGEYIHVDDLIKVLKSKNITKIIETTNSIKRMGYKGEILPFIRDLWDNRKNKHPDLPWRTINSKVVRLEFADILIQAERNGRIGIDVNGIHEFAAPLIEDEDPEVARNSIFILAVIDDEKDVGRILSLAKQQNRATFRSSVVALSEMCNSEAGKALEQLEEYIEDSEKRAYVSETRHTMKSFKERTGWCDRKF